MLLVALAATTAALRTAPTRTAATPQQTRTTPSAASTRRALARLLPAALVAASPALAVRPPDFVSQQPGYEVLPSGLQVKDAKIGAGAAAQTGDRIVYEWEGYTIGYFGRPFEMKQGAKGGDFSGERDYARFVVGRGEVIPAVEEGVLGMREGGVRQLVFPPEIGYPMVGDEREGKMADPGHDKVGPKPSSFSGSRALDFVLTSKGDQLDKTLLINLKVIRVDKPGGKYKF